MIILGIESSCDETAVSIVEDGYYLRSNVVASSMDLHKKYGGVVPEIAARSHIEVILPCLNEAIDIADASWDKIDAIAVNYGAGLGGSLLVGVLTARTLAILYKKPLIALNHIQAHVYANFITKTSLGNYNLVSKKPDFPVLAIMVSGKHGQLVLFEDHFIYKVLGRTKDDAIGEAFDKVAKMIGLSYPGGPAIAELAKKGDPRSIKLPKAQMNKYDLSYSGLKTAVLRSAQHMIGESYDFPSIKLPDRLSEAQKANIAASFQCVAVSTIVDKVKLAFEEFKPKSVVLAGGVAANQELRRQLKEALPLGIEFPDIKLCTDNAAMVASLGYYYFNAKKGIVDPYKLEIAPSLSM